MSETVIQVENVSKLYRLGEVGTGSLAHDVNRWWHRVRGKEDPYRKVGETNEREQKGDSDYAWALRGVSFEVKRGEVLGIIGRNGAGKSTLLKILSRITSQTEGRIKIKGRIASLLEVGTGFHPELTGRENIFLNGAILGMRKAEIARKFEEIVEFSGCARYIDTPVKRYSSGMSVRLGFAVAAHLEPEILIVDEVLAVGDAEFQKKCIGKMKDVAGHGRTILFVSHNMASLSNLCSHGIYLQNGQIKKEGNIQMAIENYLHDFTKPIVGKNQNRSEGLIKRVCAKNPGLNLPENCIDPGFPVEIHIEVNLGQKTVKNPRLGIGINGPLGYRVATVASYYSTSIVPHLAGNSLIRCSIPSLPLAPGDYPLKIALSSETEDLEICENLFHFSVLQTDFYGNGKMTITGHGNMLVRSEWITLKSA